MSWTKEVRMNCAALTNTLPVIFEAIDDEDIELALEEIGHAQSQLRGLQQMLSQAAANKKGEHHD